MLEKQDDEAAEIQVNGELDDVTEIVDSANNKVRMEKQLSDLKNTWEKMEFIHTSLWRSSPTCQF
jgi:hypothetical protein